MVRSSKGLRQGRRGVIRIRWPPFDGAIEWLRKIELGGKFWVGQPGPSRLVGRKWFLLITTSRHMHATFIHSFLNLDARQSPSVHTQCIVRAAVLHKPPFLSSARPCIPAFLISMRILPPDPVSRNLRPSPRWLGPSPPVVSPPLHAGRVPDQPASTFYIGTFGIPQQPLIP
jgi:hypothetical protein